MRYLLHIFRSALKFHFQTNVSVSNFRFNQKKFFLKAEEDPAASEQLLIIHQTLFRGSFIVLFFFPRLVCWSLRCATPFGKSRYLSAESRKKTCSVMFPLLLSQLLWNKRFTWRVTGSWICIQRNNKFNMQIQAALLFRWEHSKCLQN